MTRTITNPIEDSNVDSSIIRTELQTLETEIANTTSGHNHDGTDSKLIEADSMPSGIDAAKIANGSVSNTEFQYLASTGSAVLGKDDTGTMTLKTLTTPVIASIYQDAGKTKLMTLPNTSSDTLVGLAATQTLTNKTLTSPKINEDVALTPTSTELNFVDGVTSAIQTQLDAKVPITKVAVSTALMTELATGFTLEGGTTKKTLTVPLDASVSGTNTGDNPGVTSVSGTAPIASSGGTTPAISIPAATASIDGYATATQITKLDGIEALADVTDATNVASAGAYMASSIKTIRKTADETVNNSDVLQNDDDLKFAMGENDVWSFSMYVRGSWHATSDFKIDFAVPAGATGGWGFYVDSGLTANERAFGTAYTGAISGDVTPILRIHGVVINDATAGDFQFRWAQNTATAEDSKVLANSYIIAHKLN